MKANWNYERLPRVPFSMLASVGLVGSMLVLNSATSSADPGSLAGVGNYTCSVFNQTIKQDPAQEDIFFNWLEGYISGSNVMLQLDKKPLHNVSSLSPAQHKQYVRGWCNMHPSDQFVIAAYQLFSALSLMPQ